MPKYVDSAGVLRDFNGLPAAAQKRRILIPFKPGASASSTADQSQVFRLPDGTWKITAAYLDVRTPNANPTTTQLYFSAGGNAAFGSGTAVFVNTSAVATPVTASGTSTYQVAATGFIAAAGSLAGGTLLAAAFPAIGGANVTLFVQLEEV